MSILDGCDKCRLIGKNLGQKLAYPKGEDYIPDPCFRGDLPGVTNACCGHGKEGYIQFENGMVIRGQFTEVYHKDDPVAYIEQDGVIGETRDPEVIAALRNNG